MARPVNAVDFWRGFALVTIFINHIPGIYFERFTHRNVSISDSADLFVFLAGTSAFLYARKHDDLPRFEKTTKEGKPVAKGPKRKEKA